MYKVTSHVMAEWVATSSSLVRMHSGIKFLRWLKESKSICSSIIVTSFDSPPDRRRSCAVDWVSPSPGGHVQRETASLRRRPTQPQCLLPSLEKSFVEQGKTMGHKAFFWWRKRAGDEPELDYGDVKLVRSERDRLVRGLAQSAAQLLHI